MCGHRWKSTRRADNDARSVCETVCPQGALIMGRQTHPQAPLDLLPWRMLDVKGHGYVLSVLARSKEAHRDIKVAEHNGNFNENVT